MSNRNPITKNAFAAGFLMALNAFGQFGPPPVQSSPALQLPVSGRSGQSGNMVVTHQATTQGEGPSVLQPSLEVNGSFAGSVPGPDLPQGEVRLSLSEAVTRGLRVNLGSITADSSQRTARAQRAQALSQLLPQISANLGATETQIDLAALGLTAIGGSFKGVPSVVGPFHYVQGEGVVNWSAFNLTQIRNYQSSKELERAAGFRFAQCARSCSAGRRRHVSSGDRRRGALGIAEDAGEVRAGGHSTNRLLSSPPERTRASTLRAAASNFKPSRSA